MYLHRLVIEIEGEVVQQGRGIDSEIVNRPTTTAQARAYVMRAHEDQDAPGVIASNFTLYNIEIHALVDPRFYSFLYTLNN